MGTNLKDEVIIKIDRILEKVLNNFKAWDGTLESGISIINHNEIELDEFKTISLELEDSSIIYDEKHSEMFNSILLEHKKLTKFLKIGQDELLNLMQQVNKKDLIIDSYISLNLQPIFIDKDIK